MRGSTPPAVNITFGAVVRASSPAGGTPQTDGYIADRNNDVVWKIGSTDAVAGTGEAGYNGDAIAAMTAQLDSLTAVARSNGDRNVRMASSDNHIGRKATPAGIISTAGADPSRKR